MRTQKEYIEKIKNDIKRVAKEFDLDYSEKFFNFLFASRRECLLRNFIGGCPDSDYNKFGKKQAERIKNIDRFLNSPEFSEHMKLSGGTVINRKEWKRDVFFINLIKNKKLKKECLNLYKRFKLKFGNQKYFTLLTIPKNKKELDFQMKFVLRHEWTHILFIENEIYFQKLKSGYWVYDEGLVSYVDALLGNKLNNLEKMVRHARTRFEKLYWTYAIKIKKILDGKRTPKERKSAIFGFYRKLNKKR